MESLPKIPQEVLIDFYTLDNLIDKVKSNESNDVNNLMRGDIREELIQSMKVICSKWINSNRPL